MLEKKTQLLQDKITETLVNKHLFKDSLDLSIRHITCIENLSHLKGLKTLSLGFNKIASISGLHNLLELENLYLQHNLIEYVSGLDKNKNLKVINLMNNKIQKIEGLNGLIRLTELNLSGNKINKLSGIQTQKLAKLNLNDNLIESLNYLPVAPKLEQLQLSNNKISRVNQKIFNNCPKILRLDLSKNSLKNIKFLEYLTGLEDLNIGNNLIDSIDLEWQFQFLENLYINNNKITDLPYLSNIFPQLMILDLSYNSLASQTTLIQAISGLESLLNLNFIGNPIYCEGCQQKYSKVFRLEIINQKQFLTPGEKYSQQINQIVDQWRQFPELYFKDHGSDSQSLNDINELKKDGFYNQDLQKLIIGQVTKRPYSPPNKYKVDEERQKHQQQMYKQIEQTSNRIKYLQLNYQQILKRNNYPISKSETFITYKQTPPPQNQDKQTKIAIRAKSRDKPLTSGISLNEINKLSQNIKTNRQASQQKWKQLKNIDKMFQIRQFRKKSTTKQQSIQQMNRQKPNVSLPKIVTRSQRPSSKFIKTQTSNFQAIPPERMSQTYKRPPSVKKS